MLKELKAPLQNISVWFWHWAATWKWLDGLVAVAYLGSLTVHEFALAEIAVILCAFSLISLTWHKKEKGLLFKCIATLAVCWALVFLSFVTVKEKEDHPWSHLLPAKKELPAAFAVSVETKMLVPSPLKDIAGIGFWGVSHAGPNCRMWSADTAMFIRIRNLQSVRVMITAYNVYGLRGELRRIRLDFNEPFRFVQKGRTPLPMSMPPGSGNMNGGMFRVQFEDTDFSRGYPVQAELLDRQIGEHYIEPNGIVRGWAFFEFPSIGAEPVKLTIKVSDDLGHVFSYPIPDVAGNQSGDALPRKIDYGTPVDLSSCVRQPHPAP